MKKLNVAYVLKKASRMIFGICMAFFVVCMVLILLADNYQWPASVAIVLLLPLFATLVIGSYVVNKWRIWAYENVDDLEELIRRASSKVVIGKKELPGKWAVISAGDRQRLNDLLAYRRNTGQLLIPQEDDPLFPDELIVKGAKRHYLTMFLLFAASIPVMLQMRYEKTGTIEIDSGLVIVVLLLSGISLCSLYKFFFPTIRFTLSPQGFWNKERGFIPWDTVDQVYMDDSDPVEAGLSRKGAEEFLVICLTAISAGAPGEEIKTSLKNSSVKSPDLENALKIYLLRFNKTTRTKLLFGKKSARKSMTANEQAPDAVYSKY
ncbi:hypothetical protein [Niabella beijingensis]|uniref:hypothetical protein n=1 Tax=Niabella beijingensis TaxID=2872700 RepID=UPI001CBB1AF7|nr:hypothetical protein [Niabella beijingensis]MBZ4189594.1 hypothetical protein [Niabella beijingensis]